jgi:hypothetical protein
MTTTRKTTHARTTLTDLDMTLLLIEAFFTFSSKILRIRPASVYALSSPVPGLFVWLHLQTIEELVEPAEQVHHCHQLHDPLIVQAKLPHRGSMHGDSIFTAHGS